MYYSIYDNDYMCNVSFFMYVITIIDVNLFMLLHLFRFYIFSWFIRTHKYTFISYTDMHFQIKFSHRIGVCLKNKGIMCKWGTFGDAFLSSMNNFFH